MPRLKISVVAVRYACYAIGEEYAARERRALHAPTRQALAQMGYRI